MSRKHKKSTKRNWFVTHKKLSVVFAAVLLLFIAGTACAVIRVRNMNKDIEFLSLGNTKEALISIAEDATKDVPVDPKTGDLYFPESRLYVPNPKSHLKLTYTWDPAFEDETDRTEELSVSLQNVPGSLDIKTADNIDQVFERVVKLQVCSRGIRLLYDKNIDPATYGQHLELRHTVNLQNGKELYIFVESACPELDEVAELLNGVIPY